MCWNKAKIYAVMLLPVSICIQASGSNSIIYLQCVDEGDRLEIRTKMSECDSFALEIERANYNIGIFRPATTHDDLSAMDVPDCQAGKLSQAYYYGGPLTDNSWGSDWGPIFDDDLDITSSVKPPRYASERKRKRGHSYGSVPYNTGWKKGSTLYVCSGAPSAR